MEPGLAIIGKPFGHNRSATTHHRANLASDPVAAASERIDELLSAAMEKGRARVVEIGKADKPTDLGATGA